MHLELNLFLLLEILKTMSITSNFQDRSLDLLHDLIPTSRHKIIVFAARVLSISTLRVQILPGCEKLLRRQLADLLIFRRIAPAYWKLSSSRSNYRFNAGIPMSWQFPLLGLGNDDLRQCASASVKLDHFGQRSLFFAF